MSLCSIVFQPPFVYRSLVRVPNTKHSCDGFGPRKARASWTVALSSVLQCIRPTMGTSLRLIFPAFQEMPCSLICCTWSARTSTDRRKHSQAVFNAKATTRDCPPICRPALITRSISSSVTKRAVLLVFDFFTLSNGLLTRMPSVIAYSRMSLANAISLLPFAERPLLCESRK